MSVLVEHLGKDTLNDLGQFDCSPLHYACHGGKIENVKEIIRLYKAKGFSLHQLDTLMQTPLHKACRNGRSGIVKALLGNEVSITEDKFGRNPLHMTRTGLEIELD